MTTYYNQPQSEILTLEQREQRWNSERWMGEDEDDSPEGVTVYNIETMLKGDYDEEGIPNVRQGQLWAYGELSRENAESFLSMNPDLILISFVKQGDHDEF